MGQLMTSRAPVLWCDPVLRRFAAGNIGSLSIVSTQLLCCSHRGIRKAAGSPLRCSLSLHGRIPPLLGAIMAPAVTYIQMLNLNPKNKSLVFFFFLQCELAVAGPEQVLCRLSCSGDAGVVGSGRCHGDG